MEYQIVSYSGYGLPETTKYFASVVNKLIEKGWNPQGGISITYNSEWNSCWVCQAMIKED